MREGASGQLQSVIKPFIKDVQGEVLQNSSRLLQSVTYPFHKGFVKGDASKQLQSAIWPFHKGFVKENTSEQFQSVV